MNKQLGVAYCEKIPVIVNPDEEDGQYYCFDGKEYGYITEVQKKEIRSLRTEFIMITKEKNDKRSLQEIHEEFVRDADELKKETNGIINMYKTGRDSQTAINAAFYFEQKRYIC